MAQNQTGHKRVVNLPRMPVMLGNVHDPDISLPRETKLTAEELQQQVTVFAAMVLVLVLVLV